MVDKTNPIHYTRHTVQPIEEMFTVFGDVPAICNVYKYLSRHDAKDGADDIRKAKRYVEFCFNFYDKLGILNDDLETLNWFYADECVEQLLDEGLSSLYYTGQYIRNFNRGRTEQVRPKE